MTFISNLPRSCEPRRYLIAIGSPFCSNMKLPELKEVESDIQRVVQLFTDNKQGYTVPDDLILIGKTSEKIRSALSDWFSSSKRRSSDCVVIYYAGHGDEGGRFEDHYLFTVESNDGDLSKTAIETRSLIKSLFQKGNDCPQNVLLILDVCYAGIGQRQSSEVLSKLKGINSAGSGFWIIASSDSQTEAGDGTFVAALENVMQFEDEVLQRSAEFLSIDVLVQKINHEFEQTGQAQRAVAWGAEIQKRAEFIRNSQFKVEDKQVRKKMKPSRLYRKMLEEEVGKVGEIPEEQDLDSGLYHQSLGEIPDLSMFYGRVNDLKTLKKWILTERCRLVTISGLGGIGKTSLSVKLTQKIKEKFDYVYWKSLREAPPFEEVASDLIKFLSDQTLNNLEASVSERIEQLTSKLTSSRCLVVLDNFESVIKNENQSKLEQENCEKYSELLSRLGTSAHQSCLVITTREKPQTVAEQENTLKVRSLQLAGVSEEGRKILEMNKLSGSSEGLQRLVDSYSGNPLALNIVSTFIRDVFNGVVSDFLQEGVMVFSSIENLLAQQIDRLSNLERTIMYWLAINREPVKAKTLNDDILDKPHSSNLLCALERLRRCSLIERTEYGFTLQNVIMEYITERIIRESYEEFTVGKTNTTLNSYALSKATVKYYIREIQIRKIVEPIVRQLVKRLGSTRNLEVHIKGLLLTLQQDSSIQSGYVAGNILTILIESGIDLTGYDFSGLVIYQVYLQGVKLNNVNFANADLSTSVFSKTFGTALSIAFSPESDFFAIGDTNGEASLWRIHDSHCQSVFRGHSSWIRCVVFSPDGCLLATTGSDYSIRLWNSKNGECINTFQEHTDQVYSIAFDPSGQYLVSGSEDKTVRIWSIHSREVSVLQGHTDRVRSVAFSPVENLVISGGNDLTLRIWDVRTGRCANVLTGHTSWIEGVCFSPDGSIISTGSSDHTIKLWSVKTGQCIQTIEGHTGKVQSVAFSPCGEYLASGSDDNTVKLWSASSGRCLQTFYGHKNKVQAISFSACGLMIGSCSRDYTVRLWSAKKNQCIGTFFGCSSWILSIAYSKNGLHLVSGGHDRLVRVWSISDRQCIKTLEGHSDCVRSVALSNKGSIIASGSDDSTVRLWDASTGKCLKILTGHSSWVWSVAFSNDGSLLASGSRDRTIKLWKTSVSELLQTFEGHSDEVHSIAFSPDQKFIVSGSDDKTVKLWSIDKKECKKTFRGHEYPVRSVAFSLNGALIASGSDDKTVRVWNAKTGRCVRTLTGHEGRIRSIVFSPTEHILASSSEDMTIRLWNLTTGECIEVLDEHKNWIWSVAFSFDGQTIASGSQDDTIKLWSMSTKKCFATLRATRPYEGMNIFQASGLTQAQIDSLLCLGSVQNAF